MACIVDDGESLSVGINVGIDLALVLLEDSFKAFEIDVRFRENVSLSKAILCYVLTEDLDIILDFIEVCKALLHRVPGLVLSHPADSSIVVIANDKALTNIRGEEGCSLGFGSHDLSVFIEVLI